jgi:hypothetical protein
LKYSKLVGYFADLLRYFNHSKHTYILETDKPITAGSKWSFAKVITKMLFGIYLAGENVTGIWGALTLASIPYHYAWSTSVYKHICPN